MTLRFNPSNVPYQREPEPDYDAMVNRPIQMGLQALVQGQEQSRLRAQQEQQERMQRLQVGEEYGQEGLNQVFPQQQARPNRLRSFFRSQPIQSPGQVQGIDPGFYRGGGGPNPDPGFTRQIPGMPEDTAVPMPGQPGFDPGAFANRYGTKRLKMFQDREMHEANLRKINTENSERMGGGGSRYTPGQVDAILSGDPRRLAAEFPMGIPKDALSAMGSAANREASAADRQNRESDRREARTNAGVNDYGEFLQKTNIPGAISVAESVLQKLPEPGQNVPGYGPVASKVPGLLVGDEGRSMRQAVFKMFNIELKDRSGAAVIDSELERLKQEFGSGSWSTEQQLREGIAAYVSRLKEIANNVVSSTSPEYVDEYQRRGGRDIRSTFNTLGDQAAKKAAAPPKAGQSEDGFLFLGGDPSDPKNWRPE